MISIAHTRDGPPRIARCLNETVSTTLLSCWSAPNPTLELNYPPCSTLVLPPM